MKRYIRSSTTSHDVFDTTTTHMSYYDRFLNAKDLKYMQEAKNLDGKIVMMTLDEYFRSDRKSTRLNSSHESESRMPSSAWIRAHAELQSRI